MSVLVWELCLCGMSAAQTHEPASNLQPSGCYGPCFHTCLYAAPFLCAVCLQGLGKASSTDPCEPCDYGFWQPGGLAECQPCPSATFYPPVDGVGEKHTSTGITFSKGATGEEWCVPVNSQLSPEAGQVSTASSAANTICRSFCSIPCLRQMACSAGRCLSLLCHFLRCMHACMRPLQHQCLPQSSMYANLAPSKV
jgi:hypothetical protein